jgi:hypothetical protein
MSEADFQAIVGAWIARTDAEVLSGDLLVDFRALCAEQAATHSSAECRALFAQAAALPVMTTRMARAVAPFVEKNYRAEPPGLVPRS